MTKSKLSRKAILENRALIAASLVHAMQPAFKIADVREIMRCKSPEEARRLVARGTRLKDADNQTVGERKLSMN